MDSELPSEFDLLVIGTGVIESMISAAASRIGKTVLHVDSNDYYGGQWASFSLKALQNFSPNSYLTQGNCPDGWLPLGNDIFHIKHFEVKWYIPTKLNEEPPTEGCTEKNNTEQTEVYSQELLLKESRKFNIDLVPKIHFCRGEYVELLISSNIARYAEFRSVSRVLTFLNGQLEVVPCSRSDVFANNKVSVIEKRMLMKLLTSLDDTSDILKENKDLTFYQFLKDRKLSENLIHYVLYAMAGSTRESSLEEGIQGTKRFLNSLGRFGKTPFLFSMYGSGETTQAFCRLSAVFGGTYALNQSSLKALKLESNHATAVFNGDQEIKAKHFVLSAETAPKLYVKRPKIERYISRAVLITNRSIMPTEQEHLTLLKYPIENENVVINALEMGSQTGTCPRNLYLVHLICQQIKGPQEDFQDLIEHLFTVSPQESDLKPQILWSCYFSLPDFSESDLFNTLPENVYICSGPDLDLDYGSSIKKAKDIFLKIYPDLEFLPRAPDPEEIIIGDDTNQEENQAV